MKRFEQKAGASRSNPGTIIMAGLISILVATALSLSQPAAAAQVSLAWDANTEPDLFGYTVHYGEASRTYTMQRDVGNVTTCIVPDLLEGRTYYFAVTATDLTGNRSAYSNEVSFSVPGIPDINLVGNNVSIADGDTTPSTADHTDFGSALVAGGSVTRTFTIQNPGSAALTLSGSPRVAISGPNAGEFAVMVQPSASVAAGGSTTFQVTFSPAAAGARTATISIANNVTAKSPYDFAIQGTGTTAPEMDVTGNGVSIVDGDTMPAAADHTDFGSVAVTAGTIVRTFTVRNTGSAALNLTGSPRASVSGIHAADFTVTAQPSTPVAAGGNATFQVTFDPSAEGVRTAVISIANNDANENPYDFSIQGTGTAAPEIDISGNGISIADGDTTPSAPDQTDFGTVSLAGGMPVVHTFTIRNLGSGSLSLTGNPLVSISGAHAADFTVTAQPSATIGVGGSATLQVTFAPLAEGVRTAMVSLANNDADENPYNFSIQGSGFMPAETVAAPATPSGPPSPYALASCSYTVSGSSSSYGDPVQYLIEWGDGTDTGWLAVGALTAAKTWAATGSYSVRTKARCATHTSLESAWSNVLTVNVQRDVTPPSAPSGLRMP